MVVMQPMKSGWSKKKCGLEGDSQDKNMRKVQASAQETGWWA